MGFFLLLALWVGSFILGRLMQPRTPKPSASGLGDFQVPTVSESRPIPVVYGTCHVKGPNVVWYGDLGIVPIKVSGGLFAAKQTIGHKYSLGMQATICHGVIDELKEIRFDDRPISNASILVSVNNRTFAFYNSFGPPDYFNIPLGSYTSLGALAQAATSQSIGLYPGLKLLYGYEVVAGYCDQLVYAVRITGGAATNSTATLNPGVYTTGALLATEVARALNAMEATQGGGARVSFACTYDGSFFTITATLLRSGFDGWYLRGIVAYSASALGLIGIHMGQDYFNNSFPSSVLSAYDTSPQHFIWAYSGLAGKLVLSDPLFTSASLLGFPTGIDRTIGNYTATSGRNLVGVTYTDMGDFIRVSANSPTMFGGDNGEGGVVGVFDIYKGNLTQVANDYLVSVLGPLPAYRGVAYGVSRKAYLGNTPYLKFWSFIVRRTPNQLGLSGGNQNISGDANPACAIYEILTDQRWGRAIPTSQIDTASFIAAGNTLFTEGLGVSIVFDSQTPAADMITDILRHVDGVLYPDPTTGLITLKLARADYVLGTLLSIHVDNADAIKLSRPSWGETVSTVRIRFIDRNSNYTDRVAQAQNQANVQARGGDATVEEFDFRGISNATAAQKVAARVLQTVSYPLAIIQLKATRVAYQLRPGSVFRLTSVPLGITDMACRVTRISSGDLLDGTITIDALEDIFAVSWTAYTPPPASGWVNPVSAPQAPLVSALIEASYASAGGASRFVLTLCARALAGLSLNYQVWSDPTGGSNYAFTNEVSQFTPEGTLNIPMTYLDTTAVILSGVDMALLASASDPDFASGANLMLIDSEVIAWKGISDNLNGTYSLNGFVRGCMDTVPAPHALNARVWFFSAGVGSTTIDPYSGDVTVKAKLLPDGPGGVVDQSGVPEVSVTTNSRAQRPYVSRDVNLNGALYPGSISGALIVSWTHRNRLGAWTYVDGGVAAAIESGCTYTLRLYGEDGLLKKTYTGLTGTSQNWTTEIADSGFGRLNDFLRVELECVNAAAQTSFQMFNFSVWRSGASGSTPPVLSLAPVRRRKQLSSLKRIGAKMVTVIPSNAP